MTIGKTSQVQLSKDIKDAQSYILLIQHNANTCQGSLHLMKILDFLDIRAAMLYIYTLLDLFNAFKFVRGNFVSP